MLTGLEALEQAGDVFVALDQEQCQIVPNTLGYVELAGSPSLNGAQGDLEITRKGGLPLPPIKRLADYA
jgi:hypothetical protein